MKVNYTTILEKGYDLIKEDIDTIWGTEDKDKAESVMHIAGIVDTVLALKNSAEED